MIQTIKLPVWEGTYKNANKGHTKEFKLFFNEKINLIQQSNISKTFYEDNNYSFITSPPGSSKYANKLGDSYISRITNLLKGKKIKNILEIGAGSDYIAKGINKKNPYQLATLVDPALRKSSIKNIKVISSYFPSAEINNKVFDFIYSINTLEHVIDPEEFLMQVRNNITKDGFLVFIFPNIEEQFKRGDIGSLLHEHLNYFDSKSARFLFEKCGFHILESFTNNDEITLFCKKRKLPSTNIIQFDYVKEKIFYDSFSKMLARVETNKEKFLYYHSKGFR